MKKKIRTAPTTPEDYYMGLAFQAASRSRDPNGQYGAIIVDSRQRFYVIGISDYFEGVTEMPNEELLNDQIVHAEEDALSKCVGFPFETIEHSVIYTTAIPCYNCVKNIFKHKIKRIVYGPQSSHLFTIEDWQKSKELAKSLKYNLERYTGNLNWMRDRIFSLQENSPEVFQPGMPLPL